MSCPHYGCWPVPQPPLGGGGGGVASYWSMFTGLHAGERSSLAPLTRGSESKQESQQDWLVLLLPARQR